MPVESLSGRRCFVTGAASGIGRATALAAARQGADLYLTDVNAEGLEEAVAEIGRAGGRVSHAKALDVRDHDAVVALAAEIHAAHGSMDVVMNVAGVSTWGAIELLEHSDWEQDRQGPLPRLHLARHPRRLLGPALLPAALRAGDEEDERRSRQGCRGRLRPAPPPQ